MLAELVDISRIVDKYYDTQRDIDPRSLMVSSNLLTDDSPGKRPNSALVGDIAFGDTGKGNVAGQVNEMLAEEDPDGEIVSLGINGSDNAGHEAVVKGIRVAVHQLPTAITQERATAIITKGRLVHPVNLLAEMMYVDKKLGGIPGKLIIDGNAIAVTDVHRALEGMVNKRFGVGKGATGSGIAEGYSTFYQKRARFMRDFKDPNWEEAFRSDYRAYAAMMGEEEFKLAGMQVNALTIDGGRVKQPVGSENEYIDRLRTARDLLLRYIRDDVNTTLFELWRSSKTPVTAEISQGDAIDPWHGIYRDVTASRPFPTIALPDATEGIIFADQFSLRVANAKIPYMTYVGDKRNPYPPNPQEENLYREENDERGRSTGRDRDICPEDLVLMAHMQQIDRAPYSSLTHLDSAREDRPVRVVRRYLNKEALAQGRTVVERYQPHQWHWDQVVADVVEVPGWDGEVAARAKTVEDLPREAVVFLAFWGEVIAPVAIATNGPARGDRIVLFKQ